MPYLLYHVMSYPISKMLYFIFAMLFVIKRHKCHLGVSRLVWYRLSCHFSSLIASFINIFYLSQMLCCFSITNIWPNPLCRFNRCIFTFALLICSPIINFTPLATYIYWYLPYPPHRDFACNFSDYYPRPIYPNGFLIFVYRDAALLYFQLCFTCNIEVVFGYNIIKICFYIHFPICYCALSTRVFSQYLRCFNEQFALFVLPHMCYTKSF